MLRWRGAIAAGCLATLVLSSCHRIFACSEDGNCELDGVAGFCEADGHCSFPDSACASGRRYGIHAPVSLADSCVDADAASTSSTVGTTTSTLTSEASGSSGAETGLPCELTPSGPLFITEDGTVVENLSFEVGDGAPAITVEGAANVEIRNVSIRHEGAAAISFVNSPGILIENVDITHVGADALPGERAITCFESPTPTIRRVRMSFGHGGLKLESCDEGRLSFLEGHDTRAGNFIWLQYSGSTILEDFSSENDLDQSVAAPERLVYIDTSHNIEVRRGLLDGLNSVAGHGVQFHDQDASPANGLAEDVDAIRMTNGAFGAWSASGILWRRTRARDNCCDLSCGNLQGVPSSGGTLWSKPMTETDVGIEDSVYFNSCNTLIAYPEGGYDPFELTESDFAARSPIRLELCWEG